ncbi:MAG: sugar transporter [Sphingobacteriaceae bacterium]|nr:MAG: sugar transporter [Sphingobacteriaceae bacterium]
MKKLLTMAVAILFTASAFAQIEAPVKWSYAAKKLNSKEAVVLIKATIDNGWHIYSQHVKDGGPVSTSFTFTPSKDFILIGKPSEPKGITKHEKVFSMDVTYFETSVVFQQKIKLKAPKTIVKGKLEYMVCNDRQCLPPDEVEFSIAVK